MPARNGLSVSPFPGFLRSLVFVVFVINFTPFSMFLWPFIFLIIFIPLPALLRAVIFLIFIVPIFILVVPTIVFPLLGSTDTVEAL
jgi:hypothetical protein